MSSLLESFAGLLDRSVREITMLVADARAHDGPRIARLADIWDNNAFPLVRATCSGRLLRARRARAGLRWMADLGPERRALMVRLDPALDRLLPAATPPLFRDHRGRVLPGPVPVTPASVADYDLAGAGVRSITARPAETGLEVALALTAPRLFGTSEPASEALLHLTFTGVTDLCFDTADRAGTHLSHRDGEIVARIGRDGTLRARAATVWPDDSLWHESAAGRAADATTPHERPRRRRPLEKPALTEHQWAAAEALLTLIWRLRTAGNHPLLAATIPTRELCRRLDGAGSALLAAAARDRVLAGLVERWLPIPPKIPPVPLRTGEAALRQVRWAESAALLVVAVPEVDPVGPWRLAAEELNRPDTFHLTAAAFAAPGTLDRDATRVALNSALLIAGPS